MSEIIKSNYYEKIGNKFYYEEEYVKEKDKEIERLNNIINNDDVYGYIKHLEDLITKKDTIINELEKWLGSKTPYFRENDYEIGQWNGYVDCKNKLQELKGSVINE